MSPLGNTPNYNPVDEARNSYIQIVTAARVDVNLAAQLTNEYMDKNGSLLPLVISSVSIVESIIRTVSEAMEIPPDKLFSGICLGLSVRAIEEQVRDQDT